MRANVKTFDTDTEYGKQSEINTLQNINKNVRDKDWRQPVTLQHSDISKSGQCRTDDLVTR